MTDRINHAAEALGLTGADWRNGGVVIAQLTEAQVHATLALVEQQRIANLITLVTGLPRVPANLSDAAYEALADSYDGDPLPDIAAALGIEADR